MFSWWQDTKLAASGVDLGSAALFKIRLGFSGTPSDLLPKSLQPCMVEPGSDAQYMRVLTSNKFVQPSVVEAGWTVQSLLLWTVRHQPQFHALIDAGALITGMTNEEVARFLLDHGTMDACVYVLAVALALQQGRPCNVVSCAVVPRYLDAADNKVVLLRNAQHPVSLDECGVPLHRRFTFFDQAHTTGMDIPQTMVACAAVTLGKDMTFRDLAQAAWRMRRIGMGQTLHLIVVREVQRLVEEVSNTGQLVVDIVAWVVANSVRSEHHQFLRLAKQNSAQAWRREALSVLVASAFGGAHAASGTALSGAHIAAACNAFREALGVRVSDTVARPPGSLADRLEATSRLYADQGLLPAGGPGAALVQSVVSELRGVDAGLALHRLQTEGDEDMDAHMERELEVEQEADHVASRTSVRPALGLKRLQPRVWHMSDLTKPVMPHAARVTPVEAFRSFADGRGAAALAAVPRRLLASANHTPDAALDVSTPHRLRNIEVVLHWLQPAGIRAEGGTVQVEGGNMCTAVLSLWEASALFCELVRPRPVATHGPSDDVDTALRLQSLPWAIATTQGQVLGMSPAMASMLRSVRGHHFRGYMPSLDSCHGASRTAACHRTVARFLNNDVAVTPREAKELVAVLQAVDPTLRHECVALALCCVLVPAGFSPPPLAGCTPCSRPDDAAVFNRLVAPRLPLCSCTRRGTA